MAPFAKIHIWTLTLLLRNVTATSCCSINLEKIDRSTDFVTGSSIVHTRDNRPIYSYYLNYAQHPPLLLMMVMVFICPENSFLNNIVSATSTASFHHPCTTRHKQRCIKPKKHFWTPTSCEYVTKVLS